MKKQNMKNEATRRLESLISKYNLNPNILKYFKQGRVYYSYLTAGGWMGSIDTVSYDKRYEEAIKNFESKTGCMVYHAIEAATPFGEMLSLLYVGTYEEEWEFETENDDYITAYTINFTHPSLSEYGSITIGRFGNSGALVRTDI